jgi:hypothetical protein
MEKVLSISLLFVCLSTGLAGAQSLSGTYTLSSQGTTLTLMLDQDRQGNITGTLSSTTGAQFKVAGMIQNNIGVGTCVSNQGGSYFEAHPQGNQLLFALIEPGPNNVPDYNKVRKLLFTKKEGVARAPQDPQMSSKRQGGPPQIPPPASQGREGTPALSADEVSEPNWGFTFRLPKGWKVEKGPEGALLGHDTIAGAIWVIPHVASSIQEVQREMQQGLVEQGVRLQPSGQLQPLGSNAVAGIFSGTYQGQYVKARGIGTFSPNGGGAYIIAMTLPNKFGSDLQTAADTLASGMRYSKAERSDRAGGTRGAGTPSDSGNQQLMRQMAAAYYSFSSAGPSSSGGTERRVVLCPNGTYYSGSESGYSGGAGTSGAWGSASQRSGGGTWRVQGNINQGVVTMIDSSGNPTEYRYERCGGDCIYFGNNKFAVEGPANCR